jgi:replicative DNA helicase
MESDFNGFLNPAREYCEAVTLPWRKLAALIPGLLPGELVTLAARPSVGKSALAMDVAECAALAGHRVAVFSLEMSARELLRRLVCKRARVDSHKFRLGHTDQAERIRLAQAANTVSELPLVIFGPEVRTAESIAAKVRGEGFRLAVVDHLQLMTARGENRVQELAEITGALKVLAGREGLSILLLSQFSREIEKRGGAPKLSDLRDSGSIEQDSDIVLALHRPRGDDGEVIATQVFVLKQRNGPVGMVELAFRRRYVAFEEAA